MIKEKYSFLFRNLLKGFIWLIIIVGGFIVLSKVINPDYTRWLEPLYSSPAKVYTVFCLSELLFGIFPPELFMLWALKYYEPSQYVFIIAVLTGISYAAGAIGYGFGRYLNTTKMYRYLRKVRLRKYENQLLKYGLYLIIVAALTPVPYSAICMLVGSVGYPVKKFFIYSGFRIVRFAVYSYFVWEAGVLAF
ncbi:MAG: VTT domain-containing protein [Bacteroidales bacterium]|nr:VTT domain-containing protein [Bacteroidales bacterium]